MKARKCPPSRNCIAWSGTMKLNRICFSEIASRMIKGAAGRRWSSPFTEATSVTPLLTPYGCFVFSPFPLLLPSAVVLYPCSKQEVTCFKGQGAQQHPSLGPLELVLDFPLANAQHSAFPCSLTLAFGVKIQPFSFVLTSYFLLTYTRPRGAGGSGSALLHPPLLLLGSESMFHFQLSHQAASHPLLPKPPLVWLLTSLDVFLMQKSAEESESNSHWFCFNSFTFCITF